MVSPSGIAVRAIISVVGRLAGCDGVNRRRDTAHLISGRRQDKSALFQKASDEVAGGGLLVDGCNQQPAPALLKSDRNLGPVSYTHLRAHETGRNLVCRLLL